MTLDQIKEIVNSYNSLIELAKEKIKIIEKLDYEYDTRRGVERVSIGCDYIQVKCDDSTMGCYDSHYFEFPTSYLTMDEEKLTSVVIMERELRREKERKAQEDRIFKENIEREKKEREQYQKLSMKFGNSNK